MLCFFKILFLYFCKIFFSDFTDFYIKYNFRTVIDNLGLYPSKYTFKNHSHRSQISVYFTVPNVRGLETYFLQFSL